jgi:hypothetical protein
MEFRNRFLMLISLFSILNALAYGDYIMMMIPLMALYNMGEVNGNTSAHSSIQNMQVLEYTDHHIFYPLLLILLAIYGLYDYCILGCPQK